MEKDLNNKEFYNDMLKEMVKYISASKTEKSVMQTADEILHAYIKRTEHHIWLVNQCAGILKDVLVRRGQDVGEFIARVEYHDYDKLHNPKIILVYAVACDYYYGDGKERYTVYEEDLYNEFEHIAWPEHHRANNHHVAEHYGKSTGKDKPFIVPPTQDYLAIGEMIADWMAMSITHGDSAREWYKKTKNVKWTFDPIDDKIIEEFLKEEDEAQNQLAYLRQFKTWEDSTVAMQQVPTISEEDPQENNGVNEGIENFYREYDNAEDKELNDILLIEPIEQENLVEDDDSELDKYIQEVSKLVSQMEPMELKHKLGKYEDDELAIGKISDKNINMDIVNELMKYPKYLEVLKHWITVPDYTLLPDLARFGAIIDKIYKLDKPIVAYRGMRVGLVKSYKAQNEMGLVITEDGGMNDDGVEMVLKTPKSGVTEGYNFDYTIEGPLCVSRSIWITKIYGNLIVKTVIPPTARKLVITNELAYILQKLEARYFNYRPMNLSSRTEIILFPNQTFNFEVVTTNGDISEELSELHEVFYNLQEDTKEVIAGSENSIGHEAFCDQILDTKSCEVILRKTSKSHESLGIDSIEALSPDVKKKKQLIIDYICSICDIIDPSKLNSKRYHRLLDNMNDKEFDRWMHYVKEGKWRLHIVAPNLIINLKNENLLKAADKAKCKLFHRIWMTDNATGRQYLTDNEYLVLTLPVRRQQQFLDEKMSVPDNDRQIDGMTGQVTGDSRSSSITNPEIQILASRKLDATLEELVNVRGGNMLAYGEFKRQAEETGEINMTMFDPNTRSRVAVVGQVLLNSMMIDTNIVE